DEAARQARPLCSWVARASSRYEIHAGIEVSGRYGSRLCREDRPAPEGSRGRPRPRREEVEGPENIHRWNALDKPEALGSTQALAMVKRLFNAAKAGHGGTLDPLAS